MLQRAVMPYGNPRQDMSCNELLLRRDRTFAHVGAGLIIGFQPDEVGYKAHHDAQVVVGLAVQVFHLKAEFVFEGLILNVRGRGMFVQKTSGAEEAAVVAADAAFEECVRKYRALGMTYDDIQSRTSNAIFEMKSKANADAGRRVG